jgi:hypothetical protein
MVVSGRLLTVAVALFLFVANVRAEEFTFSRKDACDSAHDPYGPDAIEVTTTEDQTTVVGWVGVNCSIMLSKPSLSIEKDRVVVGVSAVFADPDGPIALCNCTEKFTMTFDGVVSDRTPVVLMVNGAQAATRDAL